MKELIGIKDLCDEQGVTRSAVSRWIASGELPPPPIKLGRRRFWHRRELAIWMRVKSRKAERGVGRG